MLSINQKNHIKVIENGVEYYSVKGLDEVKKEMLRLLSIINTISIERKISYWIDGGSLIGVLRHDGFIPWDDDLDISLLKEDYHKLIDELSKYSEENDDAYLFYRAPQSHHTCNYFASKTLYTRTEGSAISVPVKVDIRPLNSIPCTQSSLKENMELRDIANALIFGKSYGYTDKTPRGKGEIKKFFEYYNNSYGFTDPRLDNVTFVHPYFEFSSKFDLKYSDIFPLKKHKFENIEVSIPNNYHYIQTELYGDYMQLPSLEHRAPVACKVYRRLLPSFFYQRYVKTIFGNPNPRMINRILNNLYMLIIIGPIEFIKAKFYE